MKETQLLGKLMPGYSDIFPINEQSRLSAGLFFINDDTLPHAHDHVPILHRKAHAMPQPSR